MNMPPVTTSMRVLHRNLGPKRHAISDGRADVLSQRRSHARGRGAGSNPARLEHDDFLSRAQSSPPARAAPASFSRPGRCHKHHMLRIAQRRSELGQRWIGAGHGSTWLRNIVARRSASDTGVPHVARLSCGPRLRGPVGHAGLRPTHSPVHKRRLAGGEFACQVLSRAHASPSRSDPAQNVPPAKAGRQKRRPRLSDRRLLLHLSRLHALPPLTRKSDGLQVNAVLGFCNMLWKLLREMKPDERPTHLAVVFDKSEKTFRSEMYSDYKAHRPDPPDDLRPQFPLIREAVRAFDLPCLEQGGFEADDLIATYVREACEAGASAIIVASDKDLMQLVRDCVVDVRHHEGPAHRHPRSDGEIRRAAREGDRRAGADRRFDDNVPGVPGIGVKTAAQLICEYGDLDTLLARAGEIKQEKRRQALIENAEKARVCRRSWSPWTITSRSKCRLPISPCTSPTTSA